MRRLTSVLDKNVYEIFTDISVLIVNSDDQVVAKTRLYINTETIISLLEWFDKVYRRYKLGGNKIKIYITLRDTKECVELIASNLIECRTKVYNLYYKQVNKPN